ncbi:MAG: peptidase MA domain-containing protein [Dehalococcoidales bacterium]|nr:MAG: peptidase MA domain-containing protein [Dehalococcoidales bacterium]
MNLKSKRAILLGVIVSLSLLFNLAPVYAEGGLRITNSSAQVQFPLTISFSVTAESGVDITDIRLHYKVLRHSFADVTAEIYLQFVSAPEVEASWDWDMRRTGGLPPGASIQYWWTVKDASGDQVETGPFTLPFDDERFSWQRLTQGLVTMYWYSGEQAFAEELMLTIEDALDWLEADTGAILLEPIEIYLYANSQDLRGSMIFPQEWTGGVAFTMYGRIAIGISPDNLEWGKGALAHELTHLVVHQMTLNPYGGLPTWLEEGLATRSEGSLAYYYVNALNQAIYNGSLISVQSISSPFSAYADLAVLSYAESYSVVDYLVTTYGKDKMLELLETFRAGASYDGALMEVYGFDTNGLDQLWREYLSESVGTITVGVASDGLSRRTIGLSSRT